MDFHSGPLDPGSPDGDPRFGGSDPLVPGDGDTGDGEDGPFHPWLPPEDRLWRHPSEGAPVVRIDSDFGGPDRHEGRTAAVATLGLAGWRTTCAIALIAGLVGAAAVSGVAFAGGWWHQTTVVRPQLQSTAVIPASGSGSVSGADWTQADDMVADAVVSITVVGADGAEQGSGVVLFTDVDGEAYVVTDYGLLSSSIAAGDDQPKVGINFPSGGTKGGSLVGTSPLNRIAVIAVPDAGNVARADIGSVADLSDAQQVMALGPRSPSTLAVGYVSDQDQTVTLADGTDLDNLVELTGITSNVAGAPLIDASGDVVGITLSLQPVEASDQQFTFAEPIDEVFSVARAIIDGAPVPHPWLGIADADDLTPANAHQMGLAGGVRIGQVTPGSPAAKAGIEANDILTSFDGKAIDSAGAFVAALAQCTPGSPARVGWEQDGNLRSKTVVLGAEPDDAP